MPTPWTRPRSVHSYLLLAFASALLVAAASAENWQVRAKRDGVTLSRPAAKAGSVVPSRGVTIVNAPLFQVLAVIQDVPRHVEWRTRCVESRMIPLPGHEEPLTYSRSAGNWVVADRDSVVRSVLSSVEWGRDARVAFESVDSPHAPLVAGVVRTPYAAGHYALEFLGPERTRVAYQIEIDLGGYVPGFVMRFVSEDMPIETLVSLREQVNKTRGDYVEKIAHWRSLGEVEDLSETRP